MSHRTPRYLLDRFRLYVHERRNPEAPWVTAQALGLLETLLTGNDTSLEWGSGRSTAWLARRTRQLTSVEHDPAWHAQVRAKCDAAGLANVEHLLRPIATPDQRAAYVGACDRFPDGGLGLAFIDGADLRAECALAAVPKVAAGGLLVLDNANLYIDWPTRAPSSRSGRGHASPDWARFMESVSGWRLLRTSNGVWDTGVWIRPT